MYLFFEMKANVQLYINNEYTDLITIFKFEQRLYKNVSSQFIYIFFFFKM